MLNVQKYLMENGLKKLVEEFKIVVGDYDKFVVLNYNQIESPRFHPIVDECRALILEKDTWKVLCRSFNRFFNISEGVQQSKETSLSTQRIASFKENETKEFDISNAIIETKEDGSILNMWFYDGKWNVSTRKMAYAEGQTALGRTFSEVFFDTAKKTNLMDEINDPLLIEAWKQYTITFEMVGKENRVVKNYDTDDIVLIGIRHNDSGEEMSVVQLDDWAKVLKVSRPKYYKVNSYEELIELASSLPAMDEGFVMKFEKRGSEGSHFRIKVKNPAYLEIAHMRSNGAISPKRILALIISNDHMEYLSYFECDKPYFDFVEGEYIEVKNRIVSIYEENKGIKDQKEFALTIMPKVVYSFESGVIFGLRKTGGTIDAALEKLGADKITKAMNMKQKFLDKFHIKVEEEEV